MNECRSFSMNYFRQNGKLFTAIRRMTDYNLSRLGRSSVATATRITVRYWRRRGVPLGRRSMPASDGSHRSSGTTNESDAPECDRRRYGCNALKSGRSPKARRTGQIGSKRAFPVDPEYGRHVAKCALGLNGAAIALETSCAEARSVRNKRQPQPPLGAPKVIIRTGGRNAGSALRKNRAPRRGRALCSRPCGNHAARRRTENSRPERRVFSAPQP